MAKAGYTGRTVILRLRFADFSRATRSHTLPDATSAPEPILIAARALLTAATPTIARRGLTLLGLSLTNLIDTGPGPQLALEPRPATTTSEGQGPSVAVPAAARSVTSVTSSASGTSMSTFVPKS